MSERPNFFLDSNVCKPFLQLRNVQTFHFEVNSSFHYFRPPKDPYKPLPEHVKLMNDMKETIEGGFEKSVAAE
jgi:hypothetical protein